MIQAKTLSDAIKILKIKNSSDLLKPESDLALKTKEGHVINSFISAATYLGKLSTNVEFTAKTKEEEAAIYQWLEFCLLNAGCKEKEMLLELNHSLKDKVYLVGNRFTIADLLLYLSLHGVYSKLSFQDKESFCNVSRWIRLIQHDANACDLYPKIIFSKSRFYV